MLDPPQEVCNPPCWFLQNKQNIPLICWAGIWIFIQTVVCFYPLLLARRRKHKRIISSTLLKNQKYCLPVICLNQLWLCCQLKSLFHWQMTNQKGSLTNQSEDSLSLPETVAQESASVSLCYSVSRSSSAEPHQENQPVQC